MSSLEVASSIDQLMSNYKEKFQQGKFYHVYNRAVGKDNIFYTDANYIYFLGLYKRHLSPIVETYCYCLIPNHFHFLIRVEDELEDAENVVSEAFRKMAISYAQAINLQENRKGSLFMRPFKRKLIHEDSYLTRIIIYIHQNPYRHRLMKDFSDYRWSSHRSILSEAPTLLKRQDVIDWFGGEEAFIEAHRNEEDEEGLSQFLFE